MGGNERESERERRGVSAGNQTRRNARAAGIFQSCLRNTSPPVTGRAVHESNASCSSADVCTLPASDVSVEGVDPQVCRSARRLGQWVSVVR